MHIGIYCVGLACSVHIMEARSGEQQLSAGLEAMVELCMYIVCIWGSGTTREERSRVGSRNVRLATVPLSILEEMLL